MITKTSLGKGPTLYLGFVEGPIFIADLMGPRTLGDAEPLLHTMGCSNMSVWWNCVSCKLVGYQSLLAYFYVFSGYGVSLLW